ncbi:MAG: ATP-dependent DNA helicase RecQ [Gemmatimonadaceae bacterium]
MPEKPTLRHARDLLKRDFGYAQFRPGQERAVESVLEGRDTLVVLPTGGGKSLCFQVPALLLPGLTVVVSPLISLMKDQVDTLAGRGLPASYINSTLTAGEVSHRLAAAQRGAVKLLYAAPERLESGRLLGRLASIGVSLLAVDEAHCISEWGHDFRPSYLRLSRVRAELGEPATIALTATATPMVRRDIVEQLGLRRPTTIVTGFDRKNLVYRVAPCKTNAEKDRFLIAALRKIDGPAVVYASTRRDVDRLGRVLQASRIAAISYHAGLNDLQRRDVQEIFMGDRATVMVATNAFGMGIDKRNVRLVIHYAMPGTIESYYQEAGRAGRDGATSDCVLLHAYPDRFTHEFFISSAYPSRETVELIYRRLCNAGGRDNLLAADPASLTTLVGGKVKEREAESAVKILARAGAVVIASPTASRIFVRLLATPARIKRELGEADLTELELLRALWRAASSRLHDGALIDPEGLPPGFGGAAGVTTILDLLQKQQFVAWSRSGGGLRVPHPEKPLSAFAIDWDMLARHEREDRAGLDTMQRYAYTTGCRRAFILRYFGDSSARAACTGCDNCLHESSGKVQRARGGRKGGCRV